MKSLRYGVAALMLAGVVGLVALERAGTEEVAAGGSRWRAAGENWLFSSWSGDGGVTWRPSVAIVEGQSAMRDIDWSAVDNEPASPCYHRMYMGWARGGVVSSYSTDGGSSWSAPQQIPN